jgi:hypothetical protein
MIYQSLAVVLLALGGTNAFAPAMPAQTRLSSSLQMKSEAPLKKVAIGMSYGISIILYPLTNSFSPSVYE